MVVIQSHQLIPETGSISTMLSRPFWSPTDNFQVRSTIIILQHPPNSKNLQISKRHMLDNLLA